jgi:hypothetical protein
MKTTLQQYTNGRRAESINHNRNLCLVVALLLLVGTVDSLFGQGRTSVVTNLEDGGPGSLREQIAAARSGDTISVAVHGIIVLTNGELLVPNNLKILGPGATNLAISAGNQSRVLEILPGAQVNLSGLTICDGRAPDGTAGTSNSPAGGNGSDGGGIYNAGVLTIAQCVISNCAAGNGGTGYLTGTFSTSDATNWNGGVGGRGGGICNAGKLFLVSSSLSSNLSGTGGTPGGAGSNRGAGNSGGDGGAIYNVGAMVLTDSAFRYNVAGNGGSGDNFIPSWTPVGGEPGGSGGNGGAVCDAGQSTTLISNCHFTFNVSGAGAMGSTDTSIFHEPAVGGPGGAGGEGGAVWSRSSARMNDCTFVSNQTGPGASGGRGITIGGAGGVGGRGGAICAMGELGLTRCLCASNQTGSGGSGGGCNIGLAGSAGSGGSGAGVFAAGALRLNASIFRHNSAGDGGDGGGVSTPRVHPYGGGAGGMGGSGGGLYCEAGLAATNCTFEGNEAGHAGGPGAAGFDPSNSGQRSTSGSEGGQGGGIFGTGVVVLHACAIRANLGGNGSRADYGAPNIHPDFIFYSRQGGPGGAGGTGGIHAENSLRMSLCTLSGNRGGSGNSGGASYDSWPFASATGGPGGPGGAGAVYYCGSNEFMFVACTIAANTGGSGGAGGSGQRSYTQGGAGPDGAGGGGGIVNGNPNVSGRLINTLVGSNLGGTGGAGGTAGAPGAPDLQGSFSSLGHNLIGQADDYAGFTNGVNGDLVGSAGTPLDPLLGPLADNGGPTPTLALLHGSPALDAGDDVVSRPPYRLREDQRGFDRKSGSRVDIGAFEFQYHNHGGGDHSPARPPILSGTLSADKGNSHSDTTPAGQAAATANQFQLNFRDNAPGATFTVLAATDLSLPFENWSIVGQPVQISPGLFQFTDPQVTNYSHRFYRVSSP